MELLTLMIAGNETKTINAKEVFLKNRRFDLIFKYLYLKNHGVYSKEISFFEDLYCEHIRAFNNFNEAQPSDNVPKKSKEDFLRSFESLFRSINEHGFRENKSILTIGDDYELTDGSHRLAICAYLEKDIVVRKDIVEEYYDYAFFEKRSIDKFYSDFAALEYVKFNRNAYVVNLHSIADKKQDDKVEEILNKYGFIFYKKDIYLNFNGYVNLKKLSYGFDVWEGNSWIGSVENCYAGAQQHAHRSSGQGPLRAYVFVCNDLEKVIQAKAEIRAIYNLGNYSIHVNDSREEAIQLAQLFFNDNSLLMFNARPFAYESRDFDGYVNELKKIAGKEGIDIDDVCAAGSAPFSVFGIRESADLDFLYCGGKEFEVKNSAISNHDSESHYYPYVKTEIIKNPRYHFFYKGLKFITLDVLHAMKSKRSETPKDIQDCELIKKFQKGKMKLGKRAFKLFEKKRLGKLRVITIFGLIKFEYQKK